MELLEDHPKNFVSVIATEASNPPLESAKSDVASAAFSGLPQENKINSLEKEPYMINISSLKPCAPSSYVPVWQAIQKAGRESSMGSKPSSMEEWLSRAHLEVKSWENKSSRAPTHVTLNNGRFVIPEDQESEFLKWYALNLSNNSRMWFVEQLTPVFRYFIDLDFAQLVPITERAMHATAQVVQNSVMKYYPFVNKMDDSLNIMRTIVCTTNYKFINAKDGKPEMVKTGLHMLWKNVFLTRDDALNIREQIIVDLEKTFGKRLHPLNSWHDVVDAAVYGSGNSGTKGSGLRMVGSRKSDVCDLCKGAKKLKNEGGKKCYKCVGNGRLDTGRPYFPLCILNSAGCRDFTAEMEYKNNMHSLILDTKVRTSLSERPAIPEFIIPEHAPRYCHQTMKSGGIKRGRESFADKEARAGGAQKPMDPNLSKSTKCELNNNAQEWDLILKFVRRAGGGIYKNVFLHKVTMDIKRSQYVVHITGEMCRYCHNIAREHISNRIYFVIDTEGISQRCHDMSQNQTTEMQFGCCKDYVFKMERIPQSLVAQLFPSCSAAKNLIAGGSSNNNNNGSGSNSPLHNYFLNDEDEVKKGMNDNMEESHDFTSKGVKKIFNDKKLAKLFKIGDALCQELFKINWSSTLKTPSGEHVITSQKTMKTSKKHHGIGLETKYDDQYALDPAALGTRGNEAMIELGFEDLANAIMSGTEDMHEDSKKQVTPMAKLVHQLFKDVRFCVENACSLPFEMMQEIWEEGDESQITFKSFIANRMLHISKSSKV